MHDLRVGHPQTVVRRDVEGERAAPDGGGKILRRPQVAANDVDFEPVEVVAVAVTALVRWFAGDPDGPILMFYGLFPAALGSLVFVLMRWRGGRVLFALGVAVTSVANQIALFIGQSDLVLGNRFRIFGAGPSPGITLSSVVSLLPL